MAELTDAGKHPPETPTGRPMTAAFLCVAVLLAGVYSFAAITRHQHLNSRLLDLGLQHQVVWNTSEGRWFESSVEVAHYLGDHVTLTVPAIALFYRLAPAVETLLLLQVLALAVSAILLHRLAWKITQSGPAAFACGLAFLLHPACALQAINDFHFNVISLPFMFGALFAAHARRWIVASLLLVPALLSKEDIGLTLALFGVYAAWKWRARVFGASWFLAGLGWTIIAAAVILPHFRGGAPSDTWKRYEWIISPDARTIGHVALFAVRGALMLFATLAFIPLLSMEFLIGAVVFGYSFTSTASVWMANPGFQSLVPAIPFVFLSLAHGLKRLETSPPRTLPYAISAGLIALVACEFGLMWAGLPATNWLWVQTAVLIAAAIAVLTLRGRPMRSAAWLVVPIAGFVAYNPFTAVMFPADGGILQHVSPARIDDIRAAQRAVPPDASLAAADGFAPHFSARRILYPIIDALQCEYVLYSVVDRRESDGHVIATAVNLPWAEMGYEKVLDRNTLLVWRKPSHFITADVPEYETIRPPSTDTNLATSLESAGRLPEAIRYVQASLALNPQDVGAMSSLARLLRNAGRPGDAIAAYESLADRLTDKSQRAAALNGLALAQWNAGRQDAAVETLRRVLQEAPELIAAYQNLGNMLVQLRRYREALTVLRAGLERAPDDGLMLNSLAWLLATAPDASDRNGEEALRIAKALWEQSGKRDARALNTLAAALAEVGRFEEATAAAGTVKAFAEQQGDTALAAQAERLRQLYTAGQRHRLPAPDQVGDS